MILVKTDRNAGTLLGKGNGGFGVTHGMDMSRALQWAHAQSEHIAKTAKGRQKPGEMAEHVKLILYPQYLGWEAPLILAVGTPPLMLCHFLSEFGCHCVHAWDT